MLIDWFTVFAQALNFLVLVWLLKRYLYKPILHAIDIREQRIDTQVNDATALQLKAQNELDTFTHKNEVFDQQKAQLMQQASESVDREKKRLTTVAEQEAHAAQIKHQQSLVKQANKLKKTLSRKATQEIFAIARKTLEDLAGASLEQQIVTVFIDVMNALDKPAKTVFAKALKTASATQAPIVRSALALSETQRITIRQAIKQTFNVDITLKFETKPALLSGIELSANGQKLVWSIEDYLSELEQKVNNLVLQCEQTQDEKIQDKQPAVSSEASLKKTAATTGKP